MKRAILLAGSLALLLSSCYFLSLKPLYSPDTLRFSKDLLGLWEADSAQWFWHFTRESDNSYHLILSGVKEDEIAEEHYIAHLVALGESTFLDVQPRDIEPMTLGMAMPMHSIGKLDLVGDELHYIPFDYRYFRKLARSGAIEQPFQVIGSDSILVFAGSTADMQRLVQAYAQDPEALPDTLVLARSLALDQD